MNDQKIENVDNQNPAPAPEPQKVADQPAKVPSSVRAIDPEVRIKKLQEKNAETERMLQETKSQLATLQDDFNKLRLIPSPTQSGKTVWQEIEQFFFKK